MPPSSSRPAPTRAGIASSGADRDGAESAGSYDDLTAAGYKKITSNNALEDPAKYQAEAKVVLRSFFALWVDKPKLQTSQLHEAEYVFKLLAIYLERVQKIDGDKRDEGSLRWLIGRCLAFRGRHTVSETEGGIGRRLAAMAGGLAEQIADLCGRGPDGKLLPGGHYGRNAAWKAMLEDVLAVISDLDLALLGTDDYQLRSFVLFSGSDNAGASSQTDPFSNASPQKPSSQLATSDTPSITVTPPTALQARALLLSLLSFAVSLLFPSAYPPGLVSAIEGWRPLFRRQVILALIDAWPPSGTSLVDSALGGDYIRLARCVGVTRPQVWVRVLDALVQRAREAKEDTPMMDIDGGEPNEVKVIRDARRSRVDEELLALFSRLTSVWDEEQRLGDAEKDELACSAAVLTDFVLSDASADKLKSAATKALSLLPASLPVLGRVAHLFAAGSSAVTEPAASQQTSKKRKRDTSESWLSQTRKSLRLCFPSLLDEVVPVEHESSTESERRQRLVREILQRLTALRSSTLNATAENDFCRHLHPLLLHLSASLDANPPPTLSSTVSARRVQLAQATAGLHAIPVVVLRDLARAYSPNFSVKAKVVLLDGLILILERLYLGTSEEARRAEKESEAAMIETLGRALRDRERRVRLAAGRGVIALAHHHRSASSLVSAIKPIYDHLLSIFANGSPQAKETALTTLGLLSRRVSDDKFLSQIGAQLVVGLGDKAPWLRSLAHTTILSFARHVGKTPHKLFYPDFNSISNKLVESLVSMPSMLADFVALINETQENFLSTTLIYTIPRIIVERRTSVLAAMSRLLHRRIDDLVIELLLETCYHLLMQPSEDTCDRGLAYLIEIFNEQMKANGGTKFQTVATLLKASEPMKLLCKFVVDLGDTRNEVAKQAETALTRVQRRLGTAKEVDFGEFLKPYMLSIISNANDLLQDAQGKKSAEEKSKVIRSLGVLVAKIGVTMTTFSQQIMVTLQANLNKPPLRFITLQVWRTFLTTLKFKDIAPHFGPTTAAFVSSWSTFEPKERSIAASIINYAVVQNPGELGSVFDDIVSLDGLDELKEAASKLRENRRNWTLANIIRNLLRRAADENVTISFRSLCELKGVLLQKDCVLELASGNVFSPVVGELVRTLVTSAARDGEHVEELKDVSLECLGILGALDPDRFEMPPEVSSVRVADNFGTLEEAQSFALHLLVDLLVGAFRATNDVQYQEKLAYAIQELAKFCGFGKDLLEKPSDKTTRTIPLRIRERWKEIPPHKAVTIADMLDTKYSINDVPQKTIEHPIYASCGTYREWIQRWTSDLIPKTSEGNARRIFQIFRVVIKSSDVHIARHLLPDLILNVLISGRSAHCTEVHQEIRAVLEDQVHPKEDSHSDRRLLCAQTIFDLMDHISKWIRLQRTEIKRRTKSRTTPTQQQNNDEAKARLERVQRIFSEIDSGLVAQAALQCKAYPRSLLNFEQRILALQSAKSDHSQELDQQFEELHRIYARLDEPDGMEGVSTRILTPSLEHQISEHESTGRWTSAQSCWEVLIREKPNDLDRHMGLLRCLRNLGHYDTLRTHIRGLLSKQPEWETMLGSYQVEGAWMVGDWEAVERTLEQTRSTSAELAIARVLVDLRSGADTLPASMTAARFELGRPLTASGRSTYHRAYDSVVQLHLLHELQMITNAPKLPVAGLNSAVLAEDQVKKLKVALDERLGRTLPSFRAQEPILSMRRTAFGLCNSDLVDSRLEIGQAWLLSSKSARKAGHMQTAYSAILQARQSEAPFAFVQGAKLLTSMGQALRGLQELQHTLDPLLPAALNAATGRQVTQTGGQLTPLSKAALLRARWLHEAERFSDQEVLKSFRDAVKLSDEWEASYYHLGRFYDKHLSQTMSSQIESILRFTVDNYAKALRYGTKFIYRTLPRMLTIWLDQGARPDIIRAQNQKSSSESKTSVSPAVAAFKAMTRDMQIAVSTLPHYQWLTAFPQIVSRIGHANEQVWNVLLKILVLVLLDFPLQGIWAIQSQTQSTKPDRKKRCDFVLAEITRKDTTDRLSPIVRAAKKMTFQLLNLANKSFEKDVSHIRMDYHFPDLKNLGFNSPLLVPIQAALTVTLPYSNARRDSHNPFPDTAVTIACFHDDVDVMSSLQRPKKISLRGSDGRTYSFLVKPKDDLRKDARLMDFNAMINKMLKSDSESRRRNLYIRTYAVVALNDECGLCEWVNNTAVWRSILVSLYAQRGQSVFTQDVAAIYNKWRGAHRAIPPEEYRDTFEKTILPMFPPVFHEWFLDTFPEPSGWLAARLAYSRTYAVMSMVGFVLGLGDRHCENTLYDSNSGDTVHVDLNCLFDRGRTFECPERVPFRLTQNIVDGFGVTGVEGVYRNACEVTMRILRENKDSLMSVLEAFMHDPLVEWEQDKRKANKEKERERRNRELKAQDRSKKKSMPSRRIDPDAPLEPDEDLEPEATVESIAQAALEPIERKLRGVQAQWHNPDSKQPPRSKEISVPNQVQTLIVEASDPLNLGRMYVGWSAWL